MADGQVYGEEVVTLDAHPRNAIACRALGNPRTCNLERLWHGDGPAVVLAEEDHRATMDRREVQPLMEVTLTGCALTEADVAEGSLPFPFQGQADAGRFRNLRTDRARANDHASSAAAEIARGLTAAEIGRAHV